MEELIELAKQYGDWNGQTIEFNDVGLKQFVDRVTGSKQARIDELMLEYCPDEVTDEQWEEYSKHQVPVELESLFRWRDLTPYEVTEAIREGAADGGWQGFAERIVKKFKEKNK